MNTFSVFILFFTFFSFQSFAAESIDAQHIHVSFVAPKQFGPEKTTIGLRYSMDSKWHVYWKNPGDSGTTPKFEFVSKEAKVGPVLWPVPKRISFGDLVNFGYEGSVVLPFEITPEPNQTNLNLEVALEWLVCDEGECIPGFASLTLNRPIADKEKWVAEDLVEVNLHLSQVPKETTNSKWKINDLKQKGETLSVSVQGTENSDPLDLFPADGLAVRPQAPIKTKISDAVLFEFKLQAGVTAIQETDFVLYDGIQSFEWKKLPVQVASFEPTAMEFNSFLILLLSSFIGGIILNFMPCVLPVLSIKFISISQTPSAGRLKEALLYSAGVLVTFSVLGGFFLILRSAGASVGWGFQLQSPPVVFALIILFWLMALNFLGVFEFGTGVMNTAGRSSRTGAFATGILSVFVAAPCTGPFMGTALGAAATLPVLESLAIFIFLGLGLAFPFLLVALSPQARGLIPRPGAWMEKLKQFFAFPLIATVVWLLWVLNLQIGTDALPISLGVLLFLSFSLWAGKNFKRSQIILWILSILSIAYVAKNFQQRLNETSEQKASEKIWQSFSPTKVKEMRAQGKPIFIDFTAAWCITCQVNKKTVLRTSAIEKLFNDKNVALFEADWTKQDPLITEALAKLHRNSVPVYVFYPANSSEPKILPQILTPSAIEGLFQQGESK